MYDPDINYSNGEIETEKVWNEMRWGEVCKGMEWDEIRRAFVPMFILSSVYD